MRYFMGIDLGTSSVKALVVDERGGIAGSAQRDYDIRKERIEYAEQNIDMLWEATKQVIAGAIESAPVDAGQIAGIGYSGQMHGLVMLDRNGTPIRDAIIWADQRSASAIEEIYGIIPRDEYHSVSLNALSTGFLVSSLMWVKMNEPQNFEKIAKVMLPKDYLRLKMCGEYGTDVTDASGALIIDTAKRDWAWSFIDRLGFPRDIFPPCHESFEVAGEVTAACAAETGLKAGTPIVYGGGDTPMQGVGNGLIAPGTLTANIGTACQLAAILDAPKHDALYRTNTFCHICDSTWMLMGAHLSGGVALKWLRDQVLLMGSYDEMNGVAEQAPAGSEGLLFLPYLSGERTPCNDPNARGVWLGLSLKHSRAHMIRSVMEGIVLGMRNSLEIFEGLGVRYDRIIASGGGARGQLFKQIQADVFGREIYTNAGNEQACTGAALTAAVGTGAYASFREACEQMVRYSPDVVAPNMENHKLYEERFQVYKEIYSHNKDLF